MWGDIAISFQQGNGYVLAMLFCLFISLVVIFERIIMLQFVYHINFPKFLGNLKKMVAAEDLSRAVNFCKSVSGTSLPYIASRTLEARDTDPTTTRGTLEEEALSFLPRLEARMTILPGIAVVIMFLGVLGTIDSLSTAFRSIDILDTAKKQASLAQGISGSLSTAAMGLLACMIILLAQQFLRSVALKLTESMHYGVTVLNNMLVPAETMSFAPPPVSEPQPQYELASQSQQSAAVAQETPSEQPEEAPIEDIKDEEEII